MELLNHAVNEFNLPVCYTTVDFPWIYGCYHLFKPYIVIGGPDFTMSIKLAPVIVLSHSRDATKCHPGQV